MTEEVSVDILIFGGGISGLWTLDQLVRAGYNTVLFEKDRLGEGQTVQSQGIIHGGGKYTLSQNLRLDSARTISEMPSRWRQSLEGKAFPDLSKARVLSDSCYLWVSKDLNGLKKLSSFISKVGVKLINAKPKRTDDAPDFLKQSSQAIYKLEEPIVDARSVLEELAKPYLSRIIYSENFEIELENEEVKSVQLDGIKIKPKCSVMVAGVGNEDLAKKIGLEEKLMQKRPLRQITVHDVPELYGHCIDSCTTDVSITTHYDAARRRVWSVGGKIAEDGHLIDPKKLIEITQEKLSKVLRAVDFSNSGFSFFDAVRAEGTNQGERPGGVIIYAKGNVIMGWPTKLALAPILADEIHSRIRKVFKPSYKDFNYGQEIRLADYPW